MYGDIPARPFNAIMDRLDKKHIVYRRIHKEHLRETKGLLDVTRFTLEEDNSLILDHKQKNVVQKQFVMQVPSFQGHDGDNKEFEKINQFFDTHLLSCQDNIQRLITIYKGDDNC